MTALSDGDWDGIAHRGAQVAANALDALDDEAVQDAMRGFIEAANELYDLYRDAGIREPALMGQMVGIVIGGLWSKGQEGE